MMTPDEELESRANKYVAQDGEQFPYCLHCESFVYVYDSQRCMRCGADHSHIVSRPIPFYQADEMLTKRKRELFAAVVICLVIGGLALLAIFR